MAFYSLDPVRGKGERLGKIEGSELSNWNVSPDGSQIALVDIFRDRGIEVLTLPNHTWHSVSVERRWGALWTIAWAADGKGFFAVSQSSTSDNLLFVTLTGQVKLLLQTGWRVAFGTLLPSPDGKYLAVDGLTSDSNAWMLEGF